MMALAEPEELGGHSRKILGYGDMNLIPCIVGFVLIHCFRSSAHSLIPWQ